MDIEVQQFFVNFLIQYKWVMIDSVASILIFSFGVLLARFILYGGYTTFVVKMQGSGDSVYDHFEMEKRDKKHFHHTGDKGWEELDG
jgi:hypothetical protein